jgi:hypothetical protein
VTSAQRNVHYPSPQPNCKINLTHSHTIPSSHKIYFFSVLPSAHWDPKVLFSSSFPINICAYLRARSVQSHCKCSFSNKTILSINVTVKKLHLDLARDCCVFTCCHHPDHVLPSLTDRHTSSKRDAFLIPQNNDCQPPPLDYNVPLSIKTILSFN